jgi:hypothetical protein
MRSRNQKIAAVLLLAVLCVGGTELTVCRFVDPVLYETIVAPVRKAASSAWATASDLASCTWTAVSGSVSCVWDKTVSAVSRTAGALQKNEAELLENQAVVEPDTERPDPADPTITALEQRESGEILTGGNPEIVYYNQADAAWCDQPYGKDHLGKYGCGPTTLAMAISSLTDQMINPEEMAQWAVNNGYWARHGGSYLSIVNSAAADFGLEVESLPDCDAERLQLELAAGKVAVALMSKGHFTNGGHFILLRGVTLDGSILVADSNSRERSLTEWDPQIILDELSKSRNNGAPLWLLSPAEP